MSDQYTIEEKLSAIVQQLTLAIKPDDPLDLKNLLTALVGDTVHRCVQVAVDAVRQETDDRPAELLVAGIVAGSIWRDFEWLGVP